MKGHEVSTLILLERKRLETMASKLGLLHPRVIRQSRKLDRLIIKIQATYSDGST